MTESLESRLQRLEDLMAIHQLFVDYGQYLDAGDFAAYASLFAAEGEVLLGPLGRAKGPDAIRALMEGGVADEPGSSFHLVTSPQVKLDGDRASSVVMWTVVHRQPDGQPKLTMMGRHVDELIREDGRWKFLRRKGYVDIPSVMKTS